MNARSRSRRTRQVAAWMALAVAWLLLLHVGGALWAASDTMAAARDVRRLALGVGDLSRLGRAELSALDGALMRLHGSLLRLRRLLWWSSYIAEWDALPSSWQAAGVMLSDGVTVCLDLTELVWWTLLDVESGLAGAWDTLPERYVSDSAVRSLARERGRLLGMRESLAKVQAAAVTLRSERTEELQAWIDLGILATDIGLLAPQLAGESPRTVLVVFQNEDELRPTGGFVSSVAELTLRDGGIVGMRFMDSYAVDAYHVSHPPAPAPLARWMDAGELLFRDANWSPDYRESAEVLASLYAADVGREVDAVVAVTARLAGDLLEALGAVSLPEYDLVVNHENVRDVAATFWAQPLDRPGIDAEGEAWNEWLAHRKDIGAALVSAMLDALGQMDSQQLLALGRTLQEAIARKDLLIWAPMDGQMRGDLARADVDGRLRALAHDFVMVVEANVGWNKVNYRVSREVTYEVSLGAEPRAELMITYENRSAPVDACRHEARYGDSYLAMTEGCYWAYVRILVPEGAALEEAEGFSSEVDVDRYGDRSVFGGLVLVPAGEMLKVRWAYRLPEEMVRSDIDDGSKYALTAQRQPGMRDTLLTVVLDGLGQVGAPPSGWHERSDGSWAREFAWDRDVELSLPVAP